MSRLSSPERPARMGRRVFRYAGARLATRDLHRSLDRRVTRVGRLPIVGRIPRVPVRANGVDQICTQPGALDPPGLARQHHKEVAIKVPNPLNYKPIAAIPKPAQQSTTKRTKRLH